MRGNKFNIWIAYSDLFTNLTTFMVISSVGVMGLIGAGVLRQIGLGAQLRCVAAFDGVEAIAANTNLLREVEDPAVEDGDGQSSACHRYYSIGDYRYKSDVVSVYNLTKPGLPPSQTDRFVRRELLDKLCLPLWQMVSSQKFADVNGRAVLMGVSLDTSSTEPSKICNDLKDSDLSRDEDPRPLGFPRMTTPLRAIRQCQAYLAPFDAKAIAREPGFWRRHGMKWPDRLDDAKGACHITFDCLSDRALSTIPIDSQQRCQQVRDIVERDRQERLTCRRLVATSQATLLRDVCGQARLADIDGAPLPAGYQWRQGADRSDIRRRFWRDVTSQGLSLDEAEAVQARAPSSDNDSERNVPVRNGQILLKIQMYPPVPQAGTSRGQTGGRTAGTTRS